MTRLLFAMILALMTTQSLFAHFMFVHVIQDDEPRAEIHFSESAWDFSTNQRMIGLIADSRVWLSDRSAMSCQQKAYALVTPVSAEDLIACASFTYGLMTRGDSFLLEYHAKGVSGMKSAADSAGLDAEIIAVGSGADRMVLTVLFKGKPVPDAEVVVPLEGMSTETMRTDDAGRLEIDLPRTGVFSLRAMVPEQRAGVYKGTPYEMVRHYTTLTVHTDSDAGDNDSDGLAKSILRDAYDCSSEHRSVTAPWTGTFDCSFDGETTRGVVRHAGSSFEVTDPADLTPAQVDDLKLIEGLPTPGFVTDASIRFEDDRPASAGARISVEDGAFTFEVKDRRIESATHQTSSGSRRIDVLDWSDTDDQRVLPSRLMVTDFDQEGRITRVLTLDRSYTEMSGGPVLETQRGRVIKAANSSGAVMMQISEVERTEEKSEGAENLKG
jgi:hypothetical protein